MSTYRLKAAFQDRLRPLCGHIARLGITANQITILAMLISLGSGVAIALNPEAALPLLLLPLILLIRMALNAIDGMLAREFSMASAQGALLNEIGDALSDAFIYLPLALVPAFNPYLIIFITIGGLLTEITGLVAIQIGAERRYDGPMGKSDRATVLGTLAFFAGAGWLESGLWSNTLLVIILILTIATVFNRASKALNESPHAG
jgi:CDP-diacylglycerol--glycerol-3-phosphate 3-phosphatidyltransferase